MKKFIVTLVFFIFSSVLAMAQIGPPYLDENKSSALDSSSNNSSLKKEDKKKIEKKEEKKKEKKYKRIFFGEDPEDINYLGEPGMVLIKTSEKPIVDTRTGHLKWVTGQAGAGMIYAVDSLVLFTRNAPIKAGKVFQCGNLVKFHRPLDRSKIIGIFQVAKIEDRSYVFYDSSLTNQAKEAGLLIEEIHKNLLELRDEVRNLSDKMDEDTYSIRKDLAKISGRIDTCGGFWDTAWPYIIGGALVAGTGVAIYYSSRKEETHITTYVVDGGGPPADVPLGKENITGDEQQILQRSVVYRQMVTKSSAFHMGVQKDWNVSISIPISSIFSF